MTAITSQDLHQHAWRLPPGFGRTFRAWIIASAIAGFGSAAILLLTVIEQIGFSVGFGGASVPEAVLRWLMLGSAVSIGIGVLAAGPAFVAVSVMRALALPRGVSDALLGAVPGLFMLGLYSLSLLDAAPPTLPLGLVLTVLVPGALAGWAYGAMAGKPSP